MIELLIAIALVGLPAIQDAAPEPPQLKELEDRILEAFDYDIVVDLPNVPLENVPDRAKLLWLHSAAALGLPVSEFGTDSPEGIEAAVMLKLINSGPEPSESDISSLGLNLSGSQLALWRTGRARIHSGKWGKKVRLAWEDRLMDESVHPIIRGFALRHALCWALSENDEERFTVLKNSSIGGDVASFFGIFQKTFATLGGPLTALNLWDASLERCPDDLQLGPQVWVCPDPGLPPPSKGMTWVVPILGVPDDDFADEPPWRARAGQLLELPALSGCKILFAPLQKDLDLLGIVLFPALLGLDSDGNIKSIKMGDVCPG